MKYLITWHERSMGSAANYESAQKRILSLFRHWKIPEGVSVLQFLVRVGEYGGVMLIETSDPVTIHRMTSTFPAFEFRVDPVLDVLDAVAAEVEAIAWRESIPSE